MVQVQNNEAKMGGGEFIDQPGWYHVVVDEVAVEDGQYGTQIAVVVSCVGPPGSPMLGRSKKEWLPVAGKAVGKFWKWGIALGLTLADGRLMTEDLALAIIGDEKKGIQGTQEAIDLDETLAQGRQCCVKVELFKDKPTVGFNWFAIGDPHAKDCQIDQQYAAQLGADVVARHLANQKAGVGAGGQARPGQGAVSHGQRPAQGAPAQGQQRQAPPQQQRQAPPQTAGAGAAAGNGTGKGWGKF